VGVGLWRDVLSRERNTDGVSDCSAGTGDAGFGRIGTFEGFLIFGFWARHE